MVLEMSVQTLYIFSTFSKKGKLSRGRIGELLELLRKLVVVKTRGKSWQSRVTVKARDLSFLGILDHKYRVDFGKLLHLLVKEKLAYQANGRRPVRYVLKEPVVWWAYFCSRKCIMDSSFCGLYGICPYHRLLGGNNVNH